MKGLFIPEITAEMFRNGCLESIEALMAEGKIYDIDYQQPCEDCISRQAALNSLIDNIHLDGYDLAEALDAIENKEKLPPVTPKEKIIHCKDCKYRDYWGDCNKWSKELDAHKTYLLDENMFCGFAEIGGDKDVTAVTPQPKVGRWIYDKNIENWRCSECTETPKTMGYVGTADFMTEHFKYCNHCGAKMKEVEE